MLLRVGSERGNLILIRNESDTIEITFFRSFSPFLGHMGICSVALLDHYVKVSSFN